MCTSKRSSIKRTDKVVTNNVFEKTDVIFFITLIYEIRIWFPYWKSYIILINRSELKI